MSIDFSWLITALQNIATNISNFFNSIWGVAQNIVNTGQGIFTGLANFGGWLYQGLVDAFTRIYNGFTWMADQLRGGFEWIGTQLGNAYTFIAQNLYSFGQWLWSGIQGFANMIANALSYIWGVITTFFINTWNSIYTFVANFKLSIDTWWMNLIVGIRNKMKATIMYSVTTHIAWQSMTRIPKATSVKDFLYGFMGMLIAPIPAFLISEMLDVVMPSTSYTPQKVAPDLGALSFTPPTFEAIAPLPPSPMAPTELPVGVGVTGEFKPIMMGVFDGIVSPTMIVTPEAETISEEPLDVSPTVGVDTELI